MQTRLNNHYTTSKRRKGINYAHEAVMTPGKLIPDDKLTPCQAKTYKNDGICEGSFD